MNFVEFILSDYFLWFIIAIVLLCILGPFGIFGIIKFWRWVNEQFILPRRGYIKVRQKLGNDRWKTFWKKLEGNKISIKEGEINYEIPLKLGKDWIGWEGNIPFVEIDENYAQMPLSRTKVQIPKEHSTRMAYLAYLAGKAMAFKQDTRLQLLLIITIVVLIGGIAFMLWQQSNFSSSMAELANKVDSLEKSYKEFVNRTVFTPQIPRVG